MFSGLYANKYYRIVNVKCLFYLPEPIPQSKLFLTSLLTSSLYRLLNYISRTTSAPYRNKNLIQGCHGQGKQSGKLEKIQVSEKSGNFIFSQISLEKMKKVREFKKKLLVNRLLEIIFSINCKQY